jgi:hypothetical protein
MIRKFEHGILCLRNNDVNVVNIYPKLTFINTYRIASANPENQVFVETNPLLAPRTLADWSYNE